MPVQQLGTKAASMLFCAVPLVVDSPLDSLQDGYLSLKSLQQKGTLYGYLTRPINPQLWLF